MPENSTTNQVRKLFHSISNRYDLMNTLMTFGRDRSWRKSVVEMAALPPGGRLLDAGAGTGSIGLEALRIDKSLTVVAADFTFRMMAVGRSRPQGKRLLWCQADAGEMPLPDKAFDAVTSGYLIRNVMDVRKVFEEQFRLVRPGGRVVCLETSPPPANWFRIFTIFHMKYVIPFLGGLIAGNRDAYRYLPESTQLFLKPDEVADIMKDVGFCDVTWKRLMFGTQMICAGIRSEKS